MRPSSKNVIVCQIIKAMMTSILLLKMDATMQRRDGSIPQHLNVKIAVGVNSRQESPTGERVFSGSEDVNQVKLPQFPNGRVASTVFPGQVSQ
jgi:hypothetical protein